MGHWADIFPESSCWFAERIEGGSHCWSGSKC